MALAPPTRTPPAPSGRPVGPGGRRSARALVLAGVVATLAVGACTSASAVDRLADDLVEASDGALDGATATCVAEGLHDRFGEDDFARILEVAEDPERGDPTGDLRAGIVEVFVSCDALTAIGIG